MTSCTSVPTTVVFGRPANWPSAAMWVAVRVRVGDHEPVVVARMRPKPLGDEPVDRLAEGKPFGVGGRPGVEQEGAVGPEQQEEERGLPVRGFRLPELDRRCAEAG